MGRGLSSVEGTRLGWGWEEALTVDRDLLHPTPATPPWAKKALRTIAVSQVIEFLLYPPLPPPPPAPCRCWGVSLAVMDMVHVSPPWVPLSAGCRQFLCPTGQTSAGLGWVRATCLLEVQETVVRSCPHAFPLFYVFPVTKISKAKRALGPNHDAVSEELD